ncbi:glycine cleavage system protein R [Marinagarivorans algicola]|uniref:glycine cleavage system protein R n=1 Tax=Marinagarivorans algicola TaxID=1513270 RepID=UPI0006B68DD6|nr:ACT domain-containing protein [Marinagarivorans algicola]
MQLILSVLSDDRPGVVRALASVVAEEQGNWLDCQLTRLAGKFAGVVCIDIPAARKASLETALERLGKVGLRVLVDEVGQDIGHEVRYAMFNAAAPDRQGLVLEMSQALSERGISVVNLQTECSSMPYSGDPLFSARGQLAIPESLSLAAVEALLATVADELAIDFSLNDMGSAEV